MSSAETRIFTSDTALGVDWRGTGMRRRELDNISPLAGWLCGAVFLATPVVAVFYLLRQRRRPALQALLICAISLACIVLARAWMLARGIPHSHFAWIGLNVLIFVAVPFLATVIATGIFPRAPKRRRSRRSQPREDEPPKS